MNGGEIQFDSIVQDPMQVGENTVLGICASSKMSGQNSRSACRSYLSIMLNNLVKIYPNVKMLDLATLSLAPFEGQAIERSDNKGTAHAHLGTWEDALKSYTDFFSIADLSSSSRLNFAAEILKEVATEKLMKNGVSEKVYTVVLDNLPVDTTETLDQLFSLLKEPAKSSYWSHLFTSSRDALVRGENNACKAKLLPTLEGSDG